MNTENIKTIFDDYLKTENTNYALMLNGNWGSGKTFFWKNTLKQKVTDNNYKEIYISLNGISKIETLEHMLFIKLIPILGSKESSLMKNTTTLVTNVINKASSYYLKSSLSDIFKGVSVDAFNFSKYIICFDDLERSQIPVKEVFGFINNYVEHKNLKTIILTDEKEINKSQKDESYNNIKEKLIGRIINFKLDIEDTLPKLFLKKYETSNSEFYLFLDKNNKYITDVLIEYKQQNLRTISFYLEILAKIHPLILLQNDKFIKEIILFSIIVTIEFKNGKITSEKFDEFDEFAGYNIFPRTLLKKNGIDEVKVKSEKEIFTETYLDKRYDEYDFYPSIYSYILSGYLNQDDLNVQLLNKNKTGFDTPESIAFNSLLKSNFRILNDNDFEKLCIEVKSYSEKGFYSLYDYSHIASAYYYFEESKLIALTKQEIKKFLIIGLTESAKKKEINQSVFDNLFNFNADNEKVTEIREIIKKIHNEIKKEQDTKKGNELIKYIENNDEESIVEMFEKNIFLTDSFKYIISDVLFSKLVNAENQTINTFTKLFCSKYTSSNIEVSSYEDIELLKDFKNMLINYLTENHLIRPLKRFTIENLKNHLNTICENIENTKKK